MNRNLHNALLYVVKASLIAGLFYAGFSLFPLERVTSEYTAAVLTWAGIPAETYEQHGRIYLEYLQISMDCTALEIVAIFLGLILAVTSSLRKRIIFAVFGSAAVFLVNIGRISTVYYLLERGVPWYLAHDLFSGVLSILAGMLFLLISEHYLPEINKNLYTLLDAVESFFKSKTR